MDLGDSQTRLDSSPSAPANIAGFAPGTILAERYRVVALVGRGGMGEVYRADDLRLGQAVALKFLPAALEDDEVAREHLLAEVRSARTVSHPNVCRVYDVGEVNGRYFLTMEYIDGALALFAATVAGAFLVVLARHGLLACAVAATVGMALLNTPLTLDVNSWYAGRTGVVAVMIAALAYWGFRNVLGRQRAWGLGS